MRRTGQRPSSVGVAKHVQPGAPQVDDRDLDLRGEERRELRDDVQADIVAQSVKEYYSLAMIDARSAFFVSGSDVHGPMGNELVPFGTEKDAASFKLDHRGKRILRFNEITRKTIQSLN